jgi:mRNA-degrading endonuclease YafQ of YafQ-DinJ toxin-antitoxin module
MIVRFHKSFRKVFQKLPVKIQDRFSDRLTLFAQNPFHPALCNHSVDAAYPQWRSINVTGDYRALYDACEDGVAIFMKIGTHAELYR